MSDLKALEQAARSNDREKIWPMDVLILFEKLRKSEAECEWLDEGIRLALDVTVGWDQMKPAKTAEEKIERMAAFLNKALEGSQTSQYRQKLERVREAAQVLINDLDNGKGDNFYGFTDALSAALAAMGEK